MTLTQLPEFGCHPRMSHRLVAFRSVETAGSHEVMLTDPEGLADALHRRAGPRPLGTLRAARPTRAVQDRHLVPARPAVAGPRPRALTAARRSSLDVEQCGGLPHLDRVRTAAYREDPTGWPVG